MSSSNDNKKTATRSIESLNHFRCQECDKWWSVGDAPEEKEDWFCPWCGEKQKMEVEH